MSGEKLIVPDVPRSFGVESSCSEPEGDRHASQEKEPKRCHHDADDEATTHDQEEPGSELTVILRDIPPGYDWGWFSREDTRMNLQTVDKAHRAKPFKVWLEEKGKRALIPVAGMPAKALKRLEAEVAKERRRIDDWWAAFMIDNQWLTQSLHGSVITLIAYPNQPGSRFIRQVDLADYLAGIYSPESQLSPAEKKPVKPEEVVLRSELCAIEIFPQKEEGRRHHIYLPPILWQD